MTDFYCSSVDGADGTPSSETWWNGSQDTYASLTGVLAAMSGTGPHMVYVDSAHTHDAGGASLSYDFPAGASVAIRSVDRATGDKEAGASESCGTGNSLAVTFNSGANESVNLDVYGVDFLSGTALSSAISVSLQALVLCYFRFEQCQFYLRAAHANSILQLGLTSNGNSRKQKMDFVDCTVHVKDNTTGSGISVRSVDARFENLTIAYFGSNKPASLFKPESNAANPSIEIVASDLSGFNSGAYIDVSAWVGGTILIKDCKLHATPSLVTGTWLVNTASITLINTDSGDTHNVFEFRNRLGTITENTSVYLDSGAEFDEAGISWQIVTTAECTEFTPFVTPWMHDWRTETAEIDVALEVVHDSATDLHDRNLWAEWEYVSDASFPKGSVSNGQNAKPFDGTAVDWTNSAETWTGTGGFTNENKQTVLNTFTPAEKSLMRGRLNVGIASKTLYVNPAPVVS